MNLERIIVALDAQQFDRSVHGDGTVPVLSESGDLAFYVKPDATVNGNAMFVVTFTVQLPDGTKARAQAVSTAANLEGLCAALRGWKEGGHLKPARRN